MSELPNAFGDENPLDYESSSGSMSPHQPTETHDWSHSKPSETEHEPFRSREDASEDAGSVSSVNKQSSTTHSRFWTELDSASSVSSSNEDDSVVKADNSVNAAESEPTQSLDTDTPRFGSPTNACKEIGGNAFGNQEATSVSRRLFYENVYEEGRDEVDSAFGVEEFGSTPIFQMPIKEEAEAHRQTGSPSPVDCWNTSLLENQGPSQTMPSLCLSQEKELSEGSDTETKNDLSQLVADLKGRFNISLESTGSMLHRMREVQNEIRQEDTQSLCGTEIESFVGSITSNFKPPIQPALAELPRPSPSHLHHLQDPQSMERYPPSDVPNTISEDGVVDMGDDDVVQLNQLLENCGFQTLKHGDGSSSLVGAFLSVLQEYERKDELARKLLRDNESWVDREQEIENDIRQLQDERDAARKESKARIAEMELVIHQSSRDLEKEVSVRRKAESEVNKLQNQIVELEQEERSKERELENLKRNATMSEKQLETSERKSSKANDSLKKLEGQVKQMSNQIRCLENTNRTKEIEIAKLRAFTPPDSPMNPNQNAAGKEETSRLQNEVHRLTVQVRDLQREKEKEVNEWMHVVNQAKMAASNAESETKRANERTGKLENEIRGNQTRISGLEQHLRSREEEITELRQKLRQYGNEYAENEDRVVSASKRVTQLESELARFRDLVSSLEEDCKKKEREIQQWRDGTLVWDRKVSQVEERARKAENQLQKLESDAEKWKQKAAEAEQGLREKKDKLGELAGSSSALQEDCRDAIFRAEEAELGMQKLDVELQQLKQLNVHLEHVSRSHERRAEQIKATLSEKIAKEERRAKRDKDAYARMRHAHTSTKNKLAKRAGAVSRAARELRPVEIVGIYESKREGLESELATLRAEVRTLSIQLRDSENALAARERAGACRKMPEDQIMTRIGNAEKRVSELLRDLNNARSSAADAQRKAAREKAEVDRRLEALAEENASLLLELNQRPAVKDMKAAQRQIEMLERRLMKASNSGDAGEAAETGEKELGVQSIGLGPLTTRERISRDKDLHRLGLTTLDDLPKDVLVHIVQDVCISLDLNDATRLPAAVAKTLRVVASLPKLEAFVGEVCEIVLRNGAMYLPEGVSPTEPSSIPVALRSWITSLKDFDAQGQAIDSIRRELSLRVDAETRTCKTWPDVVKQVRQLVEHERNSLLAVETIRDAENLIASDPEQLLHRAIRHFQELFECPSVDGVIPCINKVYMVVTESRNFTRSLAMMLGLGNDSSVAACLNRVRQLLDQNGRSLDVKDHYVKSLRGGAEGKENEDGSNQIKLPEAREGTAGASQAFKDSIIIDVMDTLQVTKPNQVIPHCRKLVDRLRRLDEVLPKYQKMCSQLYDVLRVQSLEEIVPAVKKFVSV